MRTSQNVPVLPALEPETDGMGALDLPGGREGGSPRRLPQMCSQQGATGVCGPAFCLSI